MLDRHYTNGWSNDVAARPHAPKVTEVEHPVLGVPFYQMHPCNTAALMAAVVESSRRTTATTAPAAPAAVGPHGIDGGDYVKSWISLTGHAVGLSLPLSYTTTNR